MRLRTIAAGSNRRKGAVVALAFGLAMLAGLQLPCAAAADEAPDGADIKSAPSPSLPRKADEPDDGFVPIAKVVPRAKIVLREKERLPDLGGEETYSRFGSWTADYVWYVRDPISPMYPFAYHPIYFEDMNLERCGLSCGCMQSVVSGLMFWGTVAALPYKMLVSPPCSYVYPPGFPPDDCPPGCRFGYCENFIGPKPDFGRRLGYGSFMRRRTCHK